MKFRDVFLGTLVLTLIILSTFPMRGLYKITNLDNYFSAETIQGFWWNAKFQNVSFNSSLVGDAIITFRPAELLKGKLAIHSQIEGAHLNIEAIVGLSIKGYNFIEGLKLKARPIRKYKNGKLIYQPISKIDANINYFTFNEQGCLQITGSGTGEFIDESGLFSNNVKIYIDMNCYKKNLELNFYSTKKIVEGKILIRPNLSYTMEVKSNKLSLKLREISKLRFLATPSFKVSGNLVDLLDYL